MVDRAHRVKWLVTGASGQLGTSATAALRSLKIDCVSVTRSELDIFDLAQVKKLIQQEKPSVVLNTAAWTNVESAETNFKSAFDTNATGAGNIARVCADLGVKLVHISTDYVFGDKFTDPILESAIKSPVSAYGRTKATGEDFVKEFCPHNSYIVRTSWLYGQYGKNFAKSIILKILEAKFPLKVVEDQFGQPTSSEDLALKIIELVTRNAKSGIYHATSGGLTSWYGFAREIALSMGTELERVIPINSAEFISKAQRPTYSVLSHGAWLDAGIEPIEDWKSAYNKRSQSIIMQVKSENGYI
jgi:dTDP-4-dehydrorhamnose reductase